MNLLLNKSHGRQQLALIAFCCIVFVYVVFRAFSVPFTFDEITTSQIVESDKWMEFGNSANNHLMNTVLMKITRLFFDASVIVYRLPNVLMFVLFLIYAVRLGKLLTPVKPYLTTILLVSMPFLIDFFGLARGYGLSISFLVGSIYYVLRYSSELKTYHLLFALFFGMCAVLSNYTLLHFFLPLLLVLFLFILKSKGKIIKNLGFSVPILAVFFILVIPILFQLKEGDYLIFGGREDFFSSVIISLGRSFGYGNMSTWLPESLFAILFVVACCFSIVRIYTMIRERRITKTGVLPILFVLSILSPIAQHILLETFYPAERTALMYYPLMILLLVQGLGIYFFTWRDKILRVILFIFLANFIVSMNLSHTYSWRYESGTRNAIAYLKKIGETNKKAVSLGTDYIYTPSIWFFGMNTEFKELEVHQVIGCCWEFEMGIEELNSKYYGAGEFSKEHMSREDIDKIFSGNFDFYYLNGYTVRELERNNVPFKIALMDSTADSFLIELE